jgi:hypothetical protein
VLNGAVTLINGASCYEDAVDNLKTDAGITGDLPNMVLYDNTQCRCIAIPETGGDPSDLGYPHAEYDGYIDRITELLSAKAKREYVAPTLAELKVQAKTYQYGLYVQAKDAVVWLTDGSGYGFACDADAQANWLAAVALATDTTPVSMKVYAGKLAAISLQDVTRAQLLEAGTATHSQQLSAYRSLKSICAKIDACTTADEVQAYLGGAE